MTRYEKLQVEAFGRRAFLRLGGAALASVALLGSGCDATTDTADAEGATCDHPHPDPAGPGADGLPSTSVPPAGGWGEAIPPVTPNEEFYTVGFGVADVDPCTWRCELKVLGESVGWIDADKLSSWEARDREHTLQCIGSTPHNPAMSNAVWTGLPLAEILALEGLAVPDRVLGVRFTGADGYVTGVPVADLERPVWLVWRMNGAPLPPEHGFPARVLCPGRFGWQNAKQLVSIEFVPGDPRPEYQRGWHVEYRVQGLVAFPESMALVDRGRTVRILGRSYAGSDPIVWVGVSTDGGETFGDAELTYAPGPDRWTLWRFDWQPPAPGSYAIRCACRAESGRTTDADVGADEVPFDGEMTIQVQVA